ncbi:DUF5610 domain-containing protein [Duganella radicis]|uniref:DUF5610 domain-containing protein n=1 Tax=Duganella radicis TaxID=551988 RepID=A0A6L6PGH7_9BURK|nr:DUF5610 domain-containing protein [Duganella radicis]MTV38103.1 hypothetical protein [Duganella radicis]
MATPVSATAGNTAAPVQSRDDKPLSPAAKAKADLNVSIVQASLTVSLNSSNEPLSVVLKTALTGINEALKDDFGDNAIQNAASQDNTPEGTASRIVSLSTAFYEAYQQQHPGDDGTETLNNFINTLKKGVDQGFKEARDVLQGLKVLNGDIASNIDKTYDLVQQGFSDFLAARQPKAQQAEQTQAAT